MNRLISAQLPDAPPPKAATKAQVRVQRPPVTTSARLALPQCVMVPEHYERNYAYPLLVWLHDTGGHERELREIMPLVSLRNYVSLAVRGTRQADRGFGWSETSDGILTAESRVAEAVAEARQRFHVHNGRVFLAGSGAGGTLAIRIALRSPDEYAGAASIGGCFPQGHSPLARLKIARRSRLLIMHCRDSSSYPVQHVCNELSLFHAAGLSVTLRQYPCGDELTTQMLRDLDAWLMEQVTGSRSEVEDEATTPSEWN
jgi:phospholipase/carboxylesterase